jgi:pimeloyl-ACP methyl ester carboxylesterase
MSETDESAGAPASRFVDVGGARLHVLDAGGGGTPAVLLPGLGQSAHVFRGLMAALGGGVRAVAVTPRGHGESDTPDDGYSLAGFAADVLAVLDALGIGRAALVGHSMGGAVATRLAADHPDRVSHVVYLDSLADYAGIGRIQAKSPVRAPVIPPGAGDAAEREAQRLYAYGTWNEAAEADWRARPSAAVRAQRRELLVELLDDALSSLEPFSSLRCPALALMAGESVDAVFPWLERDDPRRPAAEAYLRDVRGPWRHASAERFRREAPHARVMEIPGNHFFFLADPERTAAAIRDFLLS